MGWIDEITTLDMPLLTYITEREDCEVYLMQLGDSASL